MSEKNAFSNLVVVGSSAGGIEALSELVSTLPADFSAPVVLAQHLDPERESNLEGILGRRSTLPVRTVSDPEPLEGGVVFVVPADRHVNISADEVGLRVDTRGRPKPSVDLLMSSAAEVYGERLIAVVLTGMGTDGAEGARAVHKAGGTVVVQDPESARFGGMPGSLAPNTVDVVADLEGIGPILEDLVSGVRVSDGEPSGDGWRDLDGFLEELRDARGIDFRSYKKPTIVRRLKRRMAATGRGSLEEYAAYVKENPEEHRHLINAFLIKVTDFFRDPELYGYLGEGILPKLLREAREEGRELRIWSAGCATGEEAHSLAILVHEALGADVARPDVRIFATDVDEEAVDFARHGVYPASALSGLTQGQIGRYFDEDGEGQYAVRKQVRAMIVFGEHDLARRSPFPRIDLVVSRNVLIYFAPELQKRALQLFTSSLRDGGYLILGKAETVSGPLAEFFGPEHRQHKVYRRKGERFLVPPPALTTPSPSPRPARPERGRAGLGDPGNPGGFRAAAGAGGVLGPRRAKALGNARELDDGFLGLLPLGAVVVDRRYDIRAINPIARRLLSVHGVAVGEDLLHLMREAPYDEVRGAIDHALRDGGIARTSVFGLEEPATGEPRFVRLDCYPLRDRGEGGIAESALVLVNDVTGEERRRRELEERLETTLADIARKEAQGARLIETNRQLEEANRELTALNEEVQNAYEEALLYTEEAQAATEEVETLNEELQATIEELNTTNEDLQARSVELQQMARSNQEEQGRLQEILESIPDAVLVINAAGRTVLTNAAYGRLFGETDFESLDSLGNDLPPGETPQDRVARGESFALEFSAESQDGVRRDFVAEGRPIGGGDMGGVILVREREGSGEVENLKSSTRGTPEEREGARAPYRSPEGNSSNGTDVERLEKELRASRQRERAARAEVREAHRRFEQLRWTGRNFAASMRESAAERHRSKQRIAAQYAVGRVLSDAPELDDAAAGALPILVGDLGWTLGVFWSLEGDVLRCRHLWGPSGDGRQAFEGACRGLGLRRGEGLPGRAWAAGKPLWVEDVSADGGPLHEPAAEAGLRSAVAFPVRDGGRTSGVFELFGGEAASPDEELLRVASVIGGQIGQFAERRRAEKEREKLLRREREARAEAEAARGRTVSVLESLGDAFMSFDRDWRFVYINGSAAEALRRLGKDPDTLPGKIVWEEIPELLGTRFETEPRHALREKEVVEYEEYLRPLDAWLSARVYPSEDGVSTYVRNVTERRRVEEALRHSEERWRTLIDKGADVITISDRDGTVRFASPSLESVCGHGVDEFVGTNPFAYGHIHPEDVKRCEEAFRELEGEPGHSVTLQHRYRHGASGEWRWLEGTFTNLFDDPAIGGLVANFRDITGRKRAEETLRESEDRLQKALSIETVGVLFFDLKGRVTDTNEAFARMIGYGRDELLGSAHWEVLTAPEFGEATARAAKELAVRGETAPYEKQFVRKDGSRWWGLCAPRRLSGSGREAECVEFVLDITERKRAEELLRQSEERFRAVANLVPDLLWRNDPSGRVGWYNERWLEYTDQTLEEATGHGWLEAIHVDDRERSRADFQHAIDAGEPLRQEHRIRAADGSYRWFLVRAEPVRDAEGRIVRWFGTATDVHEQRTALEALRENEEWLGLAQRAAHSGTWEWDLHSGELRWSSEHRELFGFEPSDEPIKLGDWWDAIHPDDLPHVEEAGRRCFEEDVEWPEVEYRIFRDGTVRWIDARGRTEKDAYGRAVRILGISTDVTGRKEAEEERDRLLAQEWVARAEVAERERISRELHDRVAHSMAVVHQSLQLHEIFKGPNPSQAAAKMALAREMAKTALESTRNLSMELRRSEAEEGFVPALQDLLKVAVPPGVRAELRAEGDESRVPPHVRGQLFSILREGVRNAVKHSGADHLRVGLDIEPEEIACSVEDDGRGFAAEPNGHNGDDGEAAGVGLRSMRERVGLLGGDFRLSSSPGGGTRVEVTVPLNGGR